MLFFSLSKMWGWGLGSSRCLWCLQGTNSYIDKSRVGGNSGYFPVCSLERLKLLNAVVREHWGCIEAGIKIVQKPEVGFNKDIAAFYQLNCCKTWWAGAWALPLDSKSAALPWIRREELAPSHSLEGQKLLEDLTVIRWTPPRVSSSVWTLELVNNTRHHILLLQKDFSWWFGFHNSSPAIVDRLNHRLGKKPMYKWIDGSWEPVTIQGLNIWTLHSSLCSL